MVQWLRTHLPIQGTWVQSPSCNYWAQPPLEKPPHDATRESPMPQQRPQAAKKKQKQTKKKQSVALVAWVKQMTLLSESGLHRICWRSKQNERLSKNEFLLSAWMSLSCKQSSPAFGLKLRLELSFLSWVSSLLTAEFILSQLSKSVSQFRIVCVCVDTDVYPCLTGSSSLKNSY